MSAGASLRITEIYLPVIGRHKAQNLDRHYPLPHGPQAPGSQTVQGWNLRRLTISERSLTNSHGQIGMILNQLVARLDVDIDGAQQAPSPTDSSPGTAQESKQTAAAAPVRQAAVADPSQRGRPPIDESASHRWCGATVFGRESTVRGERHLGRGRRSVGGLLMRHDLPAFR